MGFDFSVAEEGAANAGAGRFDKSSFWLGGMWDFQVKGSYTICFYQKPDEPDVWLVEIRDAALQWRWVDRIDANSWFPNTWTSGGYNWKENDTGAGIFEGFVDLVGDKLLGASFDIHVNYKDATNYGQLRIGANGLVAPQYPRVSFEKE